MHDVTVKLWVPLWSSLWLLLHASLPSPSCFHHADSPEMQSKESSLIIEALFRCSIPFLLQTQCSLLLFCASSFFNSMLFEILSPSVRAQCLDGEGLPSSGSCGSLQPTHQPPVWFHTDLNATSPPPPWKHLFRNVPMHGHRADWSVYTCSYHLVASWA